MKRQKQSEALARVLSLNVHAAMFMCKMAVRDVPLIAFRTDYLTRNPLGMLPPKLELNPKDCTDWGPDQLFGGSANLFLLALLLSWYSKPYTP